MFKKKQDVKKEQPKQKLFDRLKPKQKLTDKDKKIIKISFNILAIFCIILFCMAITPRSYQNDTFYTVKLGQLVRENGIDYKDHYSWHENLEYLYPHWLYDVATSIIYDLAGGFTGVYIATMLLSILLGITIYWANKKICKNDVVSFIITIGQMYLIKDYVAARAQLVTFILFALTIIFIEKFLEKPKWTCAIGLLIIPILIANFHSAVFPFYFVIFMPYVGEYLIRIILDLHLPHKIYQTYIKQSIKYNNNKLKKVEKDKAKYYQARLSIMNKKMEQSEEKFNKFIIKQKDRRKDPYKVSLERNDNTKWLILIMVIALFTGLLTPLRDMPYTYTWRIMKGNTAQSVSEHLPLTLIDNKPILISITGTIALLIFTKVKIRLRDLFFVAGLTLLTLITRRQASMLAIFGGFALARMATEIIDYYDKKGLKDLAIYMTTITGELLTITLILCLSYVQFKPKMSEVYVNDKSYPVKACEWIKENIDYKNMKIFNDYNYGSYMLFEDIPVFIDSRCDLYTPEFNGVYDSVDKKFKGQDIFSDFMNISTLSAYYETKFEEYDITHVITKPNSKLNMFISRDNNYKEIYKDDNFLIYERNVEENKEKEEKEG
ncbi:MAG: hypothetical protein IKG14_03100 [Clostridia bacterium]|nr:hypothetical protein [Clostridia bacterium]